MSNWAEEYERKKQERLQAEQKQKNKNLGKSILSIDIAPMFWSFVCPTYFLISYVQQYTILIVTYLYKVNSRVYTLQHILSITMPLKYLIVDYFTFDISIYAMMITSAIIANDSSPTYLLSRQSRLYIHHQRRQNIYKVLV